MYVTRKDLFGPDPTLNTDPDPIFLGSTDPDLIKTVGSGSATLTKGRTDLGIYFRAAIDTFFCNHFVKQKPCICIIVLKPYALCKS